MASSGIAASPAEFLGVCPRCKLLRLFNNVSQGGTKYSCNGCEWLFTIGVPTVGTPGFPATTVPVTNTTGSLVAVTISGGTLTQVKINGVLVGSTTGTYWLPAGSNISVTYSVLPGWTWAIGLTSGSMVVGATSVTIANTGTNVPFTAGETLFVDGATPEILTVVGGSTAGTVQVQACVLAHSSGVSIGDNVMVPSLSNVQKIPPPGGYGF